MKKIDMIPLPETPFWLAYGRSFSGILKWSDLDGLWAYLSKYPTNWYVFDPDKDAPEKVLSGAEFSSFLGQAKTLVNARRERSHSGAVYVNCRIAPDMTPDMIKVFDPVNMGSACAVSGVRIMPRWIVSRMKPDDLPKVEKPVARRGLFARLAGHKSA